MIIPRSKAFVPLLAALAIATIPTGCGTTSNGVSETDLQGRQMRVFEVFGMDCPGCHGGLEKLVDGIPGVVGSKAAWETRILTVYVADDARVDDATIFEAIRKANFTPGGRIK